MSDEKKKYEVEILESKGACDKDIFKKMVKRGDIVAEKLANIIGKVVTITGYAVCKVKTDEKEFTMCYYAVGDGFFSSGSEYFLDSVKEYFSDCDSFKLAEIKTKKGKTYKAVPVLAENNPKELESEDDLPF